MKRINPTTKPRTARVEKSASHTASLKGKTSDAPTIPDSSKLPRTQRMPRLLRHLKDADPIFISEPLTSYTLDSKLGRDENILVTVKTTLQMHKNDRQEEQMTRPAPDVFGREVARQYVYGFVVGLSLNHDRLSWNLSEADWVFSALEPYAVEACGNKMALTGANYAWIVDLRTGKRISIQHPWLSQVHTAQFSADGTRLLVASAGFDAVFEFDAETGEVLWEWFAWEHGFDKSHLRHHVVRSQEQYNTLHALGEDVLLVNDPRKYEFGIPTRMCPAHLNSAAYGKDGNILVTLFHQGAGIVVDKITGEARYVISGLINPHKLSTRKGAGYFVSDTRRGKLIFTDASGRRTREIALIGMPGLERSTKLSEFLQNTTELRSDLFALVDIHRNSLWLVDVRRRRYRGIKFPAEWSMHDVTRVERQQSAQIGNLIGTVFGRVQASERTQRMIRHFSPDGSETATLTLLDGRNTELNFQM